MNQLVMILVAEASSNISIEPRYYNQSTTLPRTNAHNPRLQGAERDYLGQLRSRRSKSIGKIDKALLRLKHGPPFNA
jgi:hypothetical protein